jgi:hypothetical protein
VLLLSSLVCCFVPDHKIMCLVPSCGLE